MPLSLEVVSLTPRVFIIENFLSEFEVEEIIRIAIPLQGALVQYLDRFIIMQNFIYTYTHIYIFIGGSQVGNLDGGGVRKSETRTSKNSWIKR